MTIGTPVKKNQDIVLASHARKMFRMRSSKRKDKEQQEQEEGKDSSSSSATTITLGAVVHSK